MKLDTMNVWFLSILFVAIPEMTNFF
jgi:hypothetical protein